MLQHVAPLALNCSARSGRDLHAAAERIRKATPEIPAEHVGPANWHLMHPKARSATPCRSDVVPEGVRLLEVEE